MSLAHVIFSETYNLFRTSWHNIMKWMKNHRERLPRSIESLTLTAVDAVVYHLIIAAYKSHGIIFSLIFSLTLTAVTVMVLSTCIQCPISWMSYNWPSDSAECKTPWLPLRTLKLTRPHIVNGSQPRGRAVSGSFSRDHVMASPRNLSRPQVQVEAKVSGSSTPPPSPKAWCCGLRDLGTRDQRALATELEGQPGCDGAT